MELWNESCDKHLCTLDFKTFQYIIVDHWIRAEYLLYPSDYSKVNAIF